MNILTSIIVGNGCILLGGLLELEATIHIMYITAPAPMKQFIGKLARKLFRKEPRKEDGPETVKIRFVLFEYERTPNVDSGKEEKS